MDSVKQKELLKAIDAKRYVKDAGNELVGIHLKNTQPIYLSIGEAGDLMDQLRQVLAQMVEEKEMRRIAKARFIEANGE